MARLDPMERERRRQRVLDAMPDGPEWGLPANVLTLVAFQSTRTECRGWTRRVLIQLIREGVVSHSAKTVGRRYWLTVPRAEV